MREKYRSLRRAVPFGERLLFAREAAREIESLLAENPQIGVAAFYVAKGDELPVGLAAERCLRRGIKVLLPRWNGRQKSYDLAFFGGKSRLVPGPMSVLEPPPSAAALSPGLVDLFVVPGLAFDANGTRLGYGGGWYDRILSQRRPGSIALSFCHRVQFSLDPLPREEHDEAVAVKVLGAMAAGY